MPLKDVLIFDDMQFIPMGVFASQFFMHLGKTQMVMSLPVSVGHLCIQ